jgi:threonine/homoserine/homoserine lactone efflux protein
LSLTTLSILIPTFLVVSLTPGMCMTLAMSLGMTIGVRRALWMMCGELVGVGLVATASVVGVASIVLQFPAVFSVIKIGGGLYLAWLGIQLWLSRGKLAMHIDDQQQQHMSGGQLALQGFVTAAANPKGWAFCVALLPPFIHQQQPLAIQLVIMLVVILSIEFASMLLYAGGGQTLNRLLQKGGYVRFLNRIAGTAMLFVAVWLGAF